MSALVVGFGVTGRAVTERLVGEGIEVVVVDDAATSQMRSEVEALGAEMVGSPDDATLDRLVDDAELFVPSPGVPEHHGAFAAARRRGLAVTGELDLAAERDGRPILAVTGTNGKTTVTELLVAALREGGHRAVAAGNTDVPLLSAIRDDATDIFVVEASSFRLAPLRRFAPTVATWLNFAPDHLDVHLDVDTYERSKAKIYERSRVCVANLDDPVTVRHLPAGRPVVTFGRDGGDATVVDPAITVRGRTLLDVGELWRRLPHDVDNALAVVATLEAAANAGIVTTDDEATARALHGFAGLPHRVHQVAESGGVRWYDDSKATTPHAVLAALEGFDTVVLIAGGRAKGVDLSALLDGVGRIRAVVGLGEAGADVVELFGPHRPTAVADDMGTAVRRAADFARAGDAVLLSPGCASFDLYDNYKARGRDFEEKVNAMIGETG